MSKMVSVGKVTDLEAGKGKVIEAEGKELALFNVEGKFYAIDNICLHQGGPLGEGEVVGKCVICPYHGWEYDITTGAVTFNANAKVKTYPVKVEGDDVQVEI